MELERNTAKPISPIKILKEWESDEKTILKKFISDSGIDDGYKFSFIPIGFNLQFEHSFFWQRCISNGLKPIDVLGRPFLDLRTVAVIMNRGEFKGSGLDDITNKPHSGVNIPQWYEEKKYADQLGIQLPKVGERIYSIDRNLWGVAIEGEDLENPWNQPPEDAYIITKSPDQAPEEPMEVIITFDSGIPVL